MIQKLTEYIQHPETLDAFSLKYLEELMVKYPYFQVVHLLYLQNLKRLNDPRFEEQLHISALYIFDRKVLYRLMQNTPVGDYPVVPAEEEEDNRNPVLAPTVEAESETLQPGDVISFVPEENETPVDATTNQVGTAISEEHLDTTSTDAADNDAPEVAPTEQPAVVRRTPSPLEATTDYMQYLLQVESTSLPDVTDVPLEGQGLIDSFLEKHESDDRMYLGDEEMYEPVLEPQLDVDADDGIFTETLASIYIKQGRYLKAIEIIRKLSLKYPKKNRYFADQIRYLEKLIITNKK